jgi:hypothetical protein
MNELFGSFLTRLSLRNSGHWFGVFLVSMAMLVVHADLRSGFEELTYASWFLSRPVVGHPNPMTLSWRTANGGQPNIASLYAA